VRGDEGQAADESGDVVGEALGGGALGEELLLVFGDELDVSLEVSLGHRVFRGVRCAFCYEVGCAMGCADSLTAMRRVFLALAGVFVGCAGAVCVEAQQAFTLPQILSAPYALELTAAPVGGEFAWVENAEGVRNIWVCGKGEAARQVTHYTEDDGQDVGGLVWSPDGSAIAYSYGAGNGADGKPANPAHLQRATPVVVRVQSVAGGAAVSLGEGHSPLWLKDGSEVLFVRGGQVWIAELGKDFKERQLVFDRGRAGGLTLSPDGGGLAFVSRRGGHSFIGVFDRKANTLRFLAPATGRDFAPSWSADGREIAWLRGPFTQAAEFAADRVSSDPWSVMVADVATGDARAVFTAEAGKPGSVLPHLATGEPKVFWLGDGRLGFFSEMDGWVHLYSVETRVRESGPGAPGPLPVLLTPGKGEVEDVAQGPHGELVWASNVPVCARGVCDLKDEDRRHIWRLNENHVAVAVTPGEGNEARPQVGADGTIAALVTGWMVPMHPAFVALDGRTMSFRPDAWPKEFPREAALALKPSQVLITLHGGVKSTLPVDDVRVSLHGQMFLPPASFGKGPHPALLFFHGGPMRQILLGYPSMDYYSNAFAMNQYLASLGFVVVSVNYHCGVGYGMEFRQCLHAGADGASEYADVLAAVKWLRTRKYVDAARIGIWGGSYGGYLTAMALARNSDLFAAGVDFHGVHDWNLEDNAGDWLIGNNAQKDSIAAKAKASSPIADVGRWRSPVLLIHGDNDPDVAFNQTPMLADALRARGVKVEELIFPDEVHEFLLHKDWVKAYEAEAGFFVRELKP